MIAAWSRARRRWPGAEAMFPAAVAGVMGAVCIVIFYLALSYGPVSIVAPVLASSACIPVVYGLARGERPSALQLAGLAATLAGVMLVSWTRRRRPRARPPRHRRSGCSRPCSWARCS